MKLNVAIENRLDESIEVAAYYVVSESLANIGKHAKAKTATIDVTREGDELVVEVVDDGVGGADASAGPGFAVSPTGSRRSEAAAGLDPQRRRDSVRARCRAGSAGRRRPASGRARTVAERRGLRRRRPMRGRRGVDAQALGSRGRRRDPRYPPAPDPHRRGVARGARDPRALPGDRGPRPLSIHRARTGDEAALRLSGGTGYLLKDRIGDVSEFVDAVRRVASGGSAIDPQIVSTLLSRQRTDDPLDELTPREREVLELMASGKSNHGIAESVISVGAVEQYVRASSGSSDFGRPAPNPATGARGAAVPQRLKTAASRHQKTRPPIAGLAFGARSSRGC